MLERPGPTVTRFIAHANCWRDGPWRIPQSVAGRAASSRRHGDWSDGSGWCDTHRLGETLESAPSARCRELEHGRTFRFYEADPGRSSRSRVTRWLWLAGISLILLVGAGRFERPTPCAQGRCATRLRYAPTPSILHHPHDPAPMYV